MIQKREKEAKVQFHETSVACQSLSPAYTLYMVCNKPYQSQPILEPQDTLTAKISVVSLPA